MSAVMVVVGRKSDITLAALFFYHFCKAGGEHPKGVEVQM